MKVSYKNCAECSKRFQIFNTLNKYCSYACANKNAKRIKPRSDKRAKQEKAYSELRRVFLDNKPNCERCGGVANQVHHKNKRHGDRLNEVKNWLAVCPKCHIFIENNPKISIENGWTIKQ